MGYGPGQAILFGNFSLGAAMFWGMIILAPYNVWYTVN